MPDLSSTGGVPRAPHETITNFLALTLRNGCELETLVRYLGFGLYSTPTALLLSNKIRCLTTKPNI